jgi:carboxymethylenebutenolidase
MGAGITFKRPDGKEAKGYLANAASGDAPGVVVIQEWWGLVEQIKLMVDRFALAGFDALAPDLYEGVVVPYHDADRAAKEMGSLNFIERPSRTSAERSNTSRATGPRSVSPVIAWAGRSRSLARLRFPN